MTYVQELSRTLKFKEKYKLLAHCWGLRTADQGATTESSLVSKIAAFFDSKNFCRTPPRHTPVYKVYN